MLRGGGVTDEIQTRILIVEDDRTFRETVCEILRDEGYKVKGARSFDKAVKRLSKHPFDVVLSDMRIGKHSGYEVIQIANQTRPNARIILMSRQAAPDMLQEALNSGAIYILPKPFGMIDLLQTINEVLGKNSAPQ